ncbi:hypothetical protein BP6252_12370 [Coleophoma cylindrospora]|uniref:Uncharacterized protein n=1 Tax=Coleophoma cylindrospora TaxID=1849047 RepID=A0A3D8QGW8_9HELO|nr:hypothetical protein BP6252_12370 [Coleophoma cylindrospora]
MPAAMRWQRREAMPSGGGGWHDGSMAVATAPASLPEKVVLGITDGTSQARHVDHHQARDDADNDDNDDDDDDDDDDDYYDYYVYQHHHHDHTVTRLATATMTTTTADAADAAAAGANSTARRSVPTIELRCCATKATRRGWLSGCQLIAAA